MRPPKPTTGAKTKTAKTVKAKAATAKAGTAIGSRAPAVQPTITLKQIGVQLAETHELPKRQVEALFADMIDAIVKQMKKGAKVRISGLGILQVKKRAARMGRNPATGEAIKIKASKKVAFRVAKDLKEAI
jgi:DNA-binding protein HU-beta